MGSKRNGREPKAPPRHSETAESSENAVQENAQRRSGNGATPFALVLDGGPSDSEPSDQNAIRPARRRVLARSATHPDESPGAEKGSRKASKARANADATADQDAA